MPKTTSLSKVQTIFADFPEITFSESEIFYWSAKDQTIYYCQDSLTDDHGLWQLLHEIGHFKLDHKTFQSSIALLKMEAQAWVVAKNLASKYELAIDQEHIEKCLDSYRNWLHRRSTCPSCMALGIETNDCLFHCFNCSHKWKASGNQLNRCYRQNLSPVSI